ncbi:MAG: hypothetical protein WCV88_05130 [Patescibacteria group bacterium]|jgi:FMN phosphatase YigB (HAD superfamily)
MPTIIFDLDHTLLDTTSFKQALGESWSINNPATIEVVKNIKKYLYSDSLSTLQYYLDHDYHVVICTFGNITWQTLKLQYIKFPNNIQTIITDTDKIKHLAGFNQTGNLYVDDRGDDIDQIKIAYPNLTMYWITRPNGEHTTPQPTCQHFHINSLKQLIK